MPCPWLQFTHSPCRSHADSELGGEDVYHAVELPASQLVCHSLRPETQKEREVWGRECCISFHPSLPPLPPHFWASFPLLPSCFYISCLRLPSKGQRAFVFSVCVQATSGWHIRRRIFLCMGHPNDLPLELRSLRGIFTFMYKPRVL